jgi:lipopolysaccharide/colanic/teichoic acid biosynthesis glycosyltransferase
MAETILQKLINDNVMIHHIVSKRNTGRRVLIIVGYDYFLQKRDFNRLLGIYSNIYLAPDSSMDQYALSSKFSTILEEYDDIHLVTNHKKNDQHHFFCDLATEKNKKIEITYVYDFCEKYLMKCYVPDEIISQKHDINLKYFDFRIRLFKKMVDVTGASLLMIITFPLWIYSYFRIKRESPGNVVYSQLRVGIRNEEFSCLKFRSMKLDAEVNGAMFSSKNDSRVFGYGKIMRATRIDEFPQLLNILKGELSLVGPRPERKVFTDSFEEIIPYYKERHAVKPGISGYAQVMYPYGAGSKDARHKLMYDLYYIKNWTFALEIFIICKTSWIMITRRGI